MEIQCHSCLGKAATFYLEIHCHNVIQCYVTLYVTTAPESKCRIKLVNFNFAIPVCSKKANLKHGGCFMHESHPSHCPVGVRPVTFQ